MRINQPSNLLKMAVDSQIAAHFVDVLSGATQLGSTFSSAFPIVGAVLVLIGDFLPDEKHAEILRGFKDLSNKFGQVRNDMKDLKMELQYGDVANRIELRFEYYLEIISNVSGEDEKMRYKKRLERLCDNGNCAHDLETILVGMSGKSLLKTSSILDKFYYETGGHRSRILNLAHRLVVLVLYGKLVLTTYEEMMFGKEGVGDTTENFNRRLNETTDEFLSVHNRCVENFRENMLNDINMFLDTGRSNKDLVSEMSDFISDKYDWLQNFVLVYKDKYGFDTDTFNGSRVESLHRNGKRGIVFYRTIGKLPRYSKRYDEAKKIVEQVHCGSLALDREDRPTARKCYADIVAKLEARDIGWTGCVVIRNGRDIWFDRTFSSKIISVDDEEYRIILLLE